MSRYIDADEIVYFNDTEEDRPIVRALVAYKGQIDRIPSADVAPVVHGHWIKVKHPYGNVNWYKKCSLCGKCIDWQEYNFCPYCGAIMGESESEDNA